MHESTIFEHYTELSKAVGEMNSRLEDNAIFCRVYQLPIHTDHTIPEYLNVNCLPDDESLAAAQAAYSQFEFDEVQDARTAFRLPGVVISSDTQLLSSIVAINTMKSDLKAVIGATESDKRKRSYMCNRLFPKIAMSQVYRQIVVLKDNVKAVHFTWMTRTVGSTRLSKDDALKYVDKNMEKEDAIGRSDRVVALRITRDALSTISADSVVYCRKPVPPHPRANVLYKDGTKKMHHANLPFVMFADTNDVDIVDLQSFDVANRRGRRSDRQNLVCLHEGLQLHVDRIDMR